MDPDQIALRVHGLCFQVPSQAVARKPGLQHHMGLDARNCDFVDCEQQRSRPACADVQSDQRLLTFAI